MSSSSSLLELAAQITKNAQIVNDFLVLNGHPQPSFSWDSLPEFPATAPPEVVKARRELTEAARNMCDLAMFPGDYIRRFALSVRSLPPQYHDNDTLRWIYRFNIADIVPLKEDISFADIAATANVAEDHVRRILRFAMTNNIFHEPRPDHVAHTAASSLLATDEKVKAWVGYTCEDSFPTSVHAVDASVKFKNSKKPNESAYNLAFQTSLPYFEHLAHFPEREKRFAMTMQATTLASGFNISHLANGYCWESTGNSTVIDVLAPSGVAGSTGHASIAIAAKAPEAKFIVQDLESVVEQGRANLPDQLKDRISFQTYDYFTPQPIHADIYLLRFILHDHPDDKAIEILKNLVPALKHGSKIILNDLVLPEPNTLTPTEERPLPGAPI
ncbi:O-methyltransferase [Emydomyces testavorans]|uniref:O-methyltransferase n=1 Tax=Emydomyces testavorans TaxID=2070801 RepID=A0AAF0DMD4_9EURO|nr:O-methyltransferase [Emydomyces testavorans]